MLNKEECCDYPGCRAKHTCTHQLYVTNRKNTYVRLPFCEYHRVIVAGNRFTVEVNDTESGKDGNDTEFKINGPLQEVDIIQQVIAAKELVYEQKKRKKE